MTVKKPRIILIDDDAKQLETLKALVDGQPAGTRFDVVTWCPLRDESDVFGTFERLVADGAALVVTDYDLTRNGPSGFFGLSIVAWCQRRAIPVGDYSRGTPAALPKEPNLFEFRIPTVAREAAPRILAIARGFDDLSNAINARPTLLDAPSPASMLAELLGREAEVSNFSLYDFQIGANSSLIGMLRQDRSVDRRKTIAAYVLGHLLFNSILRFPGPLLDHRALCAYFACSVDNASRIATATEAAAYEGPFDDIGPFLWRADVDHLVEDWAEEQDLAYSGDPVTYRRALLEGKLDGPGLTRYECPRCGGVRGGFLCPFTEAVVCERDDCSVGSSGWVPQGADVARVDRSFYDETSPMLGL